MTTLPSLIQGLPSTSRTRTSIRASAWLKLRNYCDIPLDKFAAFGDGENDVTMLEMAGTGIAVGNADPKAQAAASYVAKQPYGLGVVEGLRYLQLL